MKHSLVILALLFPSLALAGPNAGGILVAHDAGLLTSETNGSVSLCGQGSAPTTCIGDVDARIDGATSADPAMFKVYAIFPQGSSPRLMGLTFGVNYDATKTVITKAGNCGDFELPDSQWPGPNTGNSVTWPSANTGLITPVYCFYGYATPSMSGTVDLIPNPSQGGVFGDDAVPAVKDPIAGFGSMGFDMDGHVPACGGELGACCNRSTGACEVMSAQACGTDVFKGPATVCDPNPCGTGACCIPGAPCQDLDHAGCIAAGGAFDGLATTCALNADVDCAAGRWGACCSGAACVVTEYGNCGPTSGSIWLAGYACDPNPCEVGLGACCTGTDCSPKTEANCNAVWLSGISCALSDVCGIGMGACCGASGCAVTDSQHCDQTAAYWLPNKDCNPDPCAGLGACCEATSATCFAAAQEQCTTAWTPGVFCSPNPCGACCVALPSYSCYNTTESQCHAGDLLNFFLGSGQPCTEDPIGQCWGPVQQTTWGRIKATYKTMPVRASSP